MGKLQRDQAAGVEVRILQWLDRLQWLCWGRETALDAVLKNESMLTVTDQAADRLSEMRHGMEMQMRQDRTQALLDMGIDERDLASPL